MCSKSWSQLIDFEGFGLVSVNGETGVVFREAESHVFWKIWGLFSEGTTPRGLGLLAVPHLDI